MTETENSDVTFDAPVQVGDKVWFILDDKRYGDMVFDGQVTEVASSSMRVLTNTLNSDIWTLPFSWFDEGWIFTDKSALTQSILEQNLSVTWLCEC